MDSVKLASPASLNDCMMRNVYRYRFAVVIDFDEVIVPRFHDDYSQLVRHVDAQHRALPHTYTFHNAYFFVDLSPDVQQSAHMRTARFLRRHPPSPINVNQVCLPVSCCICGSPRCYVFHFYCVYFIILLFHVRKIYSWNSLSQSFRDASPTLEQFQRRLNTSLFLLA